MARQYKITTPDGKVMTVEGPDDATDDELISFAQDQLKQANSPFVGRETVVKKPVEQPTIAPVVQDSGLSAGAQKLYDAAQRTGDTDGIGALVTQGATFSLADEAAGVGNALVNVAKAPFGGTFNPVQAYYDGRDAERKKVDDALAAHPLLGTAATVLGGFIGLNPTAAMGAVPNALSAIRSGAKLGALGGAVSGFGAGRDTSTSLAGGVLGGALGGALGAAVPVAGATLQNARAGASRYLGRDREGLARSIVGSALDADANTGASAGALMDQAHALGVPLMLADTGDNARSLLASVGRQPGASRTIVRNAVMDRQLAQGDRIRGAIERDLGPITSTADDAAAANAAAVEQARAAREAAEQGYAGAVDRVGPAVDRLGSGSAARESFDSAYDAARQRTREAYNAPDLVNPQPIDIAGGFFSQDLRRAADAFYGDGGGEMPAALRSIIDDAAAEGATTRTLTNIDRRLADFAGQARMSGARSDAAFAERVRGDLASFADRAAPQSYRDALRAAKDVRAEQGRLFETRDLPRTFARDRYGNPLVGDTEVPTRLARPGAGGGDTADSLIASVGAERAEGVVREELRRVVEAAGGMTPAQAQAFSGRYAELLDRFPALRTDIDRVASGAGEVAATRQAEGLAGRPGSSVVERGAAGISLSPDELRREISGLAEADIPTYAQGFRNSLAGQVGRRVDDADKARALVGTPDKREALRTLFGGDEGLSRFETTLGLERAANETFASAARGSQTAERHAFDAQMMDPGLVETAFDVAVRGGQGGGLGGAALALLNRVREVGQYGPGEAGNRVRQSIASLLTETDPAALRQAIEEANAALQRDIARRQTTYSNSVDLGRGLTPGIVSAGSNIGR